ncbi:MAG: sortase [Clostridia bacterium]
MKSGIIKIKLPIILAILVFIIFLIGVYQIMIDQTEIISTRTYETVKKISISTQTNSVLEEKEHYINTNANLPEYQNLPRQYKGYYVIGKIKIPKLELEKYILEETSEDSLKVAVTRVCGPRVNEIGNVCIAGHNYTQTFGRLKELEIGDSIQMWDTYDRMITYKVYQIYKVDPTDSKCLSQETQGEREITLITCTLGAIKRTIIKAIEVYD